MKINKLIKILQNISVRKGNIEIFLASGLISCNHSHGELKNFGYFKTWYDNNKEGILLGAEDPSDYEF